MARVRVSTTVDEQLLAAARSASPDARDSKLLDEALAAFVAKHRTDEVDRSYEVYERRPLSEPDEWGDLDSFHRAAKAS